MEHEMAKRTISFSSGRNWQKYLDSMPPAAIERATSYARDWLGDLTDLSFLDIGSGSGLTALAAQRLGARVRTFDADPQSVAATERSSKGSWENGPGSILDDDFVAGLGKFDVVSSWGVATTPATYGERSITLRRWSLLVVASGLPCIPGHMQNSEVFGQSVCTTAHRNW